MTRPDGAAPPLPVARSSAAPAPHRGRPERARGTTTIVVSHDNHILTLEDGRVTGDEARGG